MKIILEVSSRKQLVEEYGEFLKGFREQGEVSIVEDGVGFGSDEILMVGAIFVIEAIKSGVTYDVVKAFLTESGSKILQLHQSFPKRPSNSISLYVAGKSGDHRYRLNVNTQEESLEVTLPNEEKLVVKAPSPKK